LSQDGAFLLNTSPDDEKLAADVETNATDSELSGLSSLLQQDHRHCQHQQHLSYQQCLLQIYISM